MPDESQAQSEARGETRAETWLSLLAHWTEFAQAAKASPSAGEGGRWKSATPAIIGLQAVTFALADVRELPADERRLGVDRAEILIHGHVAALNELWRGEDPPEGVRELIDDAQAALRALSEGGMEWRVKDERLIAEHPAELVEQLLAAEFAGDLMVPTPGTPIFTGSPAVFVRAAGGGEIEKAVAKLVGEWFDGLAKGERRAMPRQVYRQFDFGTGRVVRDLVVAMDGTLPGGQPLLVWAIKKGVAVPVTLPPRAGSSWDREMGAVRVELEEERSSGSTDLSKPRR